MLSIMVGPDWLTYVEILAKSTLYIGVGFGAFTLATFRWLEFIFDKN